MPAPHVAIGAATGSRARGQGGLGLWGQRGQGRGSGLLACWPGGGSLGHISRLPPGHLGPQGFGAQNVPFIALQT